MPLEPLEIHVQPVPILTIIPTAIPALPVLIIAPKTRDLPTFSVRVPPTGTAFSGFRSLILVDLASLLLVVLDLLDRAEPVVAAVVLAGAFDWKLGI